MTPAQARAVLRRSVPFRSWMRTELVGGSRRAKREHQEKQDRQEIEHTLRQAITDAVVQLPDGDLQWLLENGWDPTRWEPPR